MVFGEKIFGPFISYVGNPNRPSAQAPAPAVGPDCLLGRALLPRIAPGMIAALAKELSLPRILVGSSITPSLET
jgi:hypothetical protein